MSFFSRFLPDTTPPDPLLEMVDRTQAVIRFQPDGTIITANENFLRALEYDLSEIQGKHHSIFVDPDYASSANYREFWKKLAAGTVFTDRFPRRSKSGRTVWIQATYAGVAGPDGKIEAVIKIATDVTQRQNALEALSQGLHHLSNGDLTYEVARMGAPDMDEIGVAYNTATSQLRGILHAVQEVAHQVQSIGRQMGDASSQLSTRTTSQAATLEETAASLEELTATVKSSTESVQDTDQLARETVTKAENGRKVVEHSIAAMSEIATSSTEISKIISVIDDIAFQTNLLALNAGVEAARAGDAGRGFAVVASEVRGLAHRSQEAAGEIKALIGRSSDQVTRGVTLVNNTGKELKNIIESIGTISHTMVSISEAAKEQALALDEINSGVGHLDSVTQKNANMVEQMTQGNDTLMSNVENLMAQVARFKMDNATPVQFRRAG